MNRLFTLLALLLIFSGSIFAQKSSILNVNLRTDLTVSPRGRLFAIDSVVDARLDTVNLMGTWQDPSGKISELHFKNGFRPSLLNFVSTSLPNFDHKFPSYALLVRDFDLNGISETTRFELAVTFCKYSEVQSNANRTKTDVVDNSGQLTPVYQAEIIVESTNETITEVLKQGLFMAFLKFNDFLTNPTTLPPVYSDFVLEAARATQDLNLTQPTYDSIRTDNDNLLRYSQFRSGVYQSFSELRQNRPSLAGELTVQEKNDFAILRKPSGSKDKHRFYGFCDGKNLFINTGLYQSTGPGRRYAKVKSVGRYLLWIDNYVTSSERTANAIGASFGLIGALVAASANSYKDCIAMDLQTGDVFMVTPEKLAEMLTGHDDLLSEMASMPNPKDEQQQLLLLEKLNQRARTQVSR